jgi:hypothetical protein
MTRSGERSQLEAAAKQLLSRLREHDRLKPCVQMQSRHDIGRHAISDRLTQIGRRLRRLAGGDHEDPSVPERTLAK